MKHKLLILLLISGLNFYAQESFKPTDSLKKNIFKTDVTELLLAQTYSLNLSYEHLLTPKSSYQIHFNLDKLYREIGFSDFHTGLQFSYRYYFNKNKNALKGFYLSPGLRMNWRHFPNYHYYQYYFYYSDYYDFLYLDLSLETGYQFQIKNKWTIDIFGGVDKTILNFNANPNLGINYLHNMWYKTLKDFRPYFGIKFGYKF